MTKKKQIELLKKQVEDQAKYINKLIRDDLSRVEKSSELFKPIVLQEQLLLINHIRKYNLKELVKDENKPLDIYTFEEWFDSITREKLTYLADCYGKPLRDAFDELPLSTIKNYFKDALKTYYIEVRNNLFEQYTKIILEYGKKEKEDN